MKVIVDRALCVGHGLCEALDADLFEVGDDGTVRVRHDELTGDRVESARRAVATCPSRALRLAP